jgi:hypothetical protein
MRRFRLDSTALVSLCGIIQVGIGLYFVFLRPPLLPEDTRYIGSDPGALAKSVPGLQRWLQKVFWSMGGYIATTGLLTVYLARTALTSRSPGALGVLAVSGLTSVGWMARVNFVIDSDFKWPLLAPALLWMTATILYWRGR